MTKKANVNSLEQQFRNASIGNEDFYELLNSQHRNLRHYDLSST